MQTLIQSTINRFLPITPKDNIYVVSGSFQWSDLGSWERVYELSENIKQLVEFLINNGLNEYI